MKKRILLLALCGGLIGGWLAFSMSRPQGKPVPPEPNQEISTVLHAEDARKLLAEKLGNDFSILTPQEELPQGMEKTGEAVFEIKDKAQKTVGYASVNLENGEVYHLTEKGERTPLADHPFTEQEPTQAWDWNGTFVKGEHTMDLLQEDPTSVTILVNADQAYTATIAGDKAQTADGALSVRWSMQDGKPVLVVSSTVVELAGTYQAKE